MKLLMLEVKSRNTCSREAVWLQFNGLFAVQKKIYCLAVFIPLLRLELVDLSFVLVWDKQSSFSPQSHRVLKSRFKCNLNPPQSISSLVALNVIFFYIMSQCQDMSWEIWSGFTCHVSWLLNSKHQIVNIEMRNSYGQTNVADFSSSLLIITMKKCQQINTADAFCMKMNETANWCKNK